MTDDWMMRFGGTVEDVEHIDEDITFEFTFDPFGDGTTPSLKIGGLPGHVRDQVRVFPWQAPLISSRPSDVPASAPLALYADVLIFDTFRPANDFPSGGPLGLPFDPLDVARFPNGRRVLFPLRAIPFVFPYVAQ